MAAVSLEDVLDGLLNKNNAVRAQAEAYYQRVSTSSEEAAGEVRGRGEAGAWRMAQLPVVCAPRRRRRRCRRRRSRVPPRFPSRAPALSQMCVALLSRLGGAGAAERHKLLAAVLLRRLLEARGPAPAHEPVWGRLAPPVQASVQSGLLAALAAEPRRAMAQKIAHVVASLAARAAGAGGAGWPQLLPSVFALARAPAPLARENALFMFTRLADVAGAELLAPHAAALLPVMTALLADGACRRARARHSARRARRRHRLARPARLLRHPPAQRTTACAWPPCRARLR